MAVPKPKNTNVRLLACLVDEDDTDNSDYRFLLDMRDVKYVTTAPGTFRGAEDDRTFEPILLGKLLPPFPIGNWNKGYVAKDPKAGEITFVKTETIDLTEVENLWHPVKLNELDFTRQSRIKQRVHISTHPKLNDGEPVLVKIAVWPWEIPYIEVETTAYQRINDSGIGPKFLGHLTEGKDGRVVGFVVEWVQGARAAGSGDIDSCKKALGRLHELGIKFGDINKHNFLVRDGHDVLLVDFETAKHNCLPQELEDEMKALESSLEDTSFRSGVGPIDE
ncbi:hypothetical protein ONS95_002240 [Cadophora gregata]|uniref:uncharacterized protein n=1 Tax=Cadophora gregata TaxID=51156 RepID=UPI0026DAA10A|nr:uncharacterized protein ONS95_002240 [Cadophora gregata]KAK0109554.1 hypothetical protein ONS95_002240 [Cadophora gregata]KAK0110818.1 hypothetical protein ONS96_002411 [Cadophora gregata f. sp. sojae]